MKEIEKILLEQIKYNNTPSVQYILFNRDSIIKKFSYGYVDIKGNRVVSDEVSYNAYSITKTFTALAILKLMEQDKLDIENPVKNYLSEFPYGSEITIRQILTHSAGIPNPLPLNWIHLATEHESFDRNNFFYKVISKNSKIQSGPNEKFIYSNLGYVVLGQLIEKITGKSYESYINEHIISKMGVTDDLGFEIRNDVPHARGYQKRISILNLMLGLYIDKSKYMGRSEEKWKPFNDFYVNGISYGGLIGIPSAFVKYGQELLKPNCFLISDSFKKMLFKENKTSDNRPTGMCLSWFKGILCGSTYFTHAGGGGGYYCEIRLYPDLDLGSVIFFNRTGISDERFLDKVDMFYLLSLK